MQNEKMQKAYAEIKNILATRTINDDDLQKLKMKYGEEKLREVLILCLPEDIGLKLFMDKTMFDGMYEGGATRVAYETLNRIQSDPANAGAVYEGVLNDLDEENKERYAESEPVVLTGGVISGCKQDPRERKKPIVKKLVVAGAVLTLTAICSIALVACNNKEKDQGGINTDPPIVSAQTTAGEIFDNVVDKNALMNFASNCATDKVKEAFAGAESVDFISSTQDGKSFALVTKGGETTLYAIVSDLTDVDRAILNENAESQVWETVEMDRDTAVKESEEKAVTQKITDAVTQYKAMVLEIIEKATLTKTEYTEIDDELVANDQVAKALGNFEAVFFGRMTESMKYTGDAQFSTENCTMSYAFGLNKDGKLSIFVVTYPDNGESSQEKLNAIANKSALISLVGEISPGETFKFPPLKQEEQTITAEELYNQVFGENYSLKSFNQFFDELMDDVLSSVSEYQVLFADLTEDNFTIYSNAKLIQGKTVLAQSKYKGNDAKTILDFYELSKQIGEKTFKEYILEMIGSEIIIDSLDYQEKVEYLQNIKSQADLFASTISSISKSQFTTTTLITNTTTSIDFSAFEEKFIPEGVEPIACYVGEMGSRQMNNIFGTGYTTGFQMLITYYNYNNNVLTQKEFTVIVPWYTNSTDESSYQKALGEEGQDNIISGESVATIQKPILTGNTSGITAKVNAELEK